MRAGLLWLSVLAWMGCAGSLANTAATNSSSTSGPARTTDTGMSAGSTTGSAATTGGGAGTSSSASAGSESGGSRSTDGTTTGGTTTSGGDGGEDGGLPDAGEQDDVSFQQACFTYVGGISAVYRTAQTCGMSLLQSETLQQCETQYAVCRSLDWLVISNVGSCMGDLSCDTEATSNFSTALSMCASVFYQASAACAAVGFGTYGDGGF